MVVCNADFGHAQADGLFDLAPDRGGGICRKFCVHMGIDHKKPAFL